MKKELVYIIAYLEDGVGKAISGIKGQLEGEFDQTVLLLEIPEKGDSINKIIRRGCRYKSISII